MNMDYAENQITKYTNGYSAAWGKYDWVKIGCRIREERKNLNLSQDALINLMRDRGAGLGKVRLGQLEKGTYGKEERINSKSELGDLENGVPVPGLTLLQMTALCDIFECDIGYLLCEYDEKTWQKRDVAKYTGLSEEAIDALHALSLTGDRLIHVLPFINLLLSDYNTLLEVSTRLNTIAAITDMAKGNLLERDKMYKDGALFSLSRIIADTAEKLVQEPAQPT